MAANVLQYHNRNPYRSKPEQQQLVIFSANGYEISLLARILSPIALRVLIVLASKLTGEGYSKVSLDELARLIDTPRSFVNKGILQLNEHGLIKKKKQSEYWLNPDLFRPALIEIRR